MLTSVFLLFIYCVFGHKGLQIWNLCRYSTFICWKLISWMILYHKENKQICFEFHSSISKIMTLHLKNKKFDMKIICAYCILYLQFHHQRMLFWSDPDTWCLWHHSHWGDPWERGGVSLNVPVCHRISPARGRLSFSTVPWAAVVRFMGRYALWGRDGTAMTHTACLCPPSSKHWPNFNSQLTFQN